MFRTEGQSHTHTHTRVVSGGQCSGLKGSLSHTHTHGLLAVVSVQDWRAVSHTHTHTRVVSGGQCSGLKGSHTHTQELLAVVRTEGQSHTHTRVVSGGQCSGLKGSLSHTRVVSGGQCSGLKGSLSHTRVVSGGQCSGLKGSLSHTQELLAVVRIEGQWLSPAARSRSVCTPDTAPRRCSAVIGRPLRWSCPRRHWGTRDRSSGSRTTTDRHSCYLQSNCVSGKLKENSASVQHDSADTHTQTHTHTQL